MIKQLPAFPAAPFYNLATDNSIRAQFRFGKYNKYNEADGVPIKLMGNAVVEEDAVKLTGDGRFEFPVNAFGAGDFTIEAKVTFYDWSSFDGSYIFGQYYSSITNDDSWNLRVSNTSTKKRALFILSRPGTVVSTPEGPYNLELNKEYHIVVERVSGVITIYIDGSVYSTYAYAHALHIPVSNLVTSETRSVGYGRCTRRIRDIRIADRALYHGAVYNNLKRFRTQEPNYVRLMYPVYQGKIKNATPKGSVVTTNNVRLNAANSWLEIPYDPKYAVGTGNFRFEIKFTYHGNASNWSTQTNPLLQWNTWAAPGQPCNLEILWHPIIGGIYLSTDHSDSGASAGILPAQLPVIGNRYDLVIERINGVVHLHINGELISSVPWTNSIDAKTSRPVLIGQRYGGSNYSVYWTTLMTIEHCWFGIPLS